MANTRSAEKRHRQSLKRRARNLHWRSSVKSAIRKVREAAAGKDLGKAKELLKAAEKMLKKASSKGVVHRRAASRHVSRLAKMVGTLGK